MLLTELIYWLEIRGGLAFMHNFCKAWCQGLTPSYIISGIFASIKKACHLASDGDKTNLDLLIYVLCVSQGS